MRTPRRRLLSSLTPSLDPVEHTMSRFLISVTLALVVLLLPSSWAAAQQPGSLPELTLEDALRQALKGSPQLQVWNAELQEAEARLAGARTLPYNPVVDVEAGKRTSSEGAGADFSVGVTQELEIAGQWGKRIQAATAELSAAQATFTHSRRALAAEVYLAFFEALRSREILEISRQDVELARTLQDAARRRAEAGSSTQLDLNLATAELGRAEERMFLAQGAYLEACSLLAEVIGLDPGAPPEPKGDLMTETSPTLPPLPDLLKSAEENRPDLEVLRLTEQAVQARLKLARSEAYPNVSVGGFYGREGTGDTVVGGGVSVAIPLFNRNQGAIAEARATGQRASAERTVLQLQVRREVAAAYARYQAANASVNRLRETVLGTLEENLQLLRKAFEAGKTSSTEVVVIRRTFIEAQRELVEAAVMARRDRVTLDLAAGRLTLPETEKQDNK